LLALLSAGAFAQVPLRDDHSGPYNVTILEGGEGLTRSRTWLHCGASRLPLAGNTERDKARASRLAAL
jgi:hypothetical protein